MMSDPPEGSLNRPPPPVRPPLWRASVLAATAVALLAGLPYVPGLPPQPAAAAATLLFLLISLLLISECARYPLRPLWDVLGMVAGLGLWYVVGLPAAGLPAWQTVVGAVSGVSFLLACVGAGRLLALIVRERNLLLPVALVAGLADVFTVFAGPTGKALQHAPKLVERLSVAIPKIGSALGPAGAKGAAAIATAGLGDFIFLTFFLVGVYRFGLRARLTFWVVFALVALGMGTVILVPGVAALPLLPFAVVGFLLANLGAFRLSRAEKIQTTAVVALVTALLVAAGWLMRHR
jgi:hypothetical protein